MSTRTSSTPDHRQGAAASLLNGLAVLEAFSISTPTLGVTDVASRVGLHKSTVSRILSGLAEVGYVERQPESGRYRLGLSVIALSAPLLAELDVRRAALPYLQLLQEETSETAAVSVWNGSEAVVVEQVPSPHQVKHSASIGTRYTSLASSSVRVFLAELGPGPARQVVDARRITIPDDTGWTSSIEQELAEVRRRGYAVNDGRTTLEEFGLSAPVRDFRGYAVGCLTLSAPRSRVHREHDTTSLAASVQSAAQRVSIRLGSPVR